MKTFFPKSGSQLEWEAARRRLEDYLRALNIADPAQQNQIIPPLLERAAGRHAENPEFSPTALVMDEFRGIMERWFAKNLSSGGRVSVAGPVRLAALDAPEKWPASFMAEDVPADLQRALRECEVRALPDLQVASMVPQPFENPLRNAINLPVPLMTKVAASMLSALSILSGYRLR